MKTKSPWGDRYWDDKELLESLALERLDFFKKSIASSNPKNQPWVETISNPDWNIPYPPDTHACDIWTSWLKEHDILSHIAEAEKYYKENNHSETAYKEAIEYLKNNTPDITIA